MPLTYSEIDGCREAFRVFDADGSGSIDAMELNAVLEALGQRVTSEELFSMIHSVEPGCTTISFPAFLRIIEKQKERASRVDDYADLLDAFVAVGGKPDGSGSVKREVLEDVIKNQFGLSINIGALIDLVDVDGSGEIEFSEFVGLLTAKRTVPPGPPDGEEDEDGGGDGAAAAGGAGS